MLTIPAFAAEDDWLVVVDCVSKKYPNNVTSTFTERLTESKPSFSYNGGNGTPYYRYFLSDIRLTANVPGTFNITVSGFRFNSSDWTCSDSFVELTTTSVTEHSVAATFTSAGSSTITCSSKADAQNVSVSVTFTPTGSGPSGGSYDIHGWNGDDKTGSQSQGWETYNTYIGQYITYIGDSQKSLTSEQYTAWSFQQLIYEGWSWQYNPDTGEIEFTLPDNGDLLGGSWADMIYRTSVYQYFWGDKLWSNDVNGSWFGSMSSHFSYLNTSVRRILDVLANDEDFAIKEATNDERQWLQTWFESDTGNTSRFDSVNSISGDVESVFSGIDSSIDVGTAFNSTDEGYTFWSQQCYDDIFNVDASGFVSSSDASTFSRSSSPVVDDSQIIYDAFSARWERIVNPVD